MTASPCNKKCEQIIVPDLENQWNITANARLFVLSIKHTCPQDKN